METNQPVQPESVALRPAPTPELLQNLAMMVSLAKVMPLLLVIFLLSLIGPKDFAQGDLGAIWSTASWYVAMGLSVLLVGLVAAHFVAARRTNVETLFAWAMVLLVWDVLVLASQAYTGIWISALVCLAVTASQVWVAIWANRARKFLIDPAKPPEIRRARLW